jgi:hypothetical protein
MFSFSLCVSSHRGNPIDVEVDDDQIGGWHVNGLTVNFRKLPVALRRDSEFFFLGVTGPSRAVSYTQVAVVDENTRMFSSFSPNSVLKIGFG